MPTDLADDRHSNGPLSQRRDGSSRRFRRVLLFWLGPAMGLCALAWFLIRVLPKPSRAGYPCQRAAFPIASGFILWLTGFLGATVAWKKARQLFAAAKYTPAIACVMLAAFLGMQWWNSTPENTSFAYADYVTAALQTNHPLGTGKGIFPGRVTWIRDVNATTWDGYQDTGSGNTKSWWGTTASTPSSSNPGNRNGTFTDQNVVNSMVSNSLQWLTGKPRGTNPTDQAAWNAMFHYFNQHHKYLSNHTTTVTSGTKAIGDLKGDVGYQTGETLFIKTNWVSFTGSQGGTGIMTGSRRYVYPSIELIIAILNQLKDAGVPTNMVTMGDPARDWPQHVYTEILTAFPAPNTPKFVGIHNLKRSQSPYLESTYYQTQITWPANQSSKWYSSSDAGTGYATYNQDYVPSCWQDADYVINLAQFKTHARNGVSLAGKSYIGSLGRNPQDTYYFNDSNYAYNPNVTNEGGYSGSSPPAGTKRFFDLHAGLLNNNSNTGNYQTRDDYGLYRSLVDLSGHPKMGGNVLVNIIDALYSGYDWSSVSPPKRFYSLPEKTWTTPQNLAWNTSATTSKWWPSSILMSIDPVAIDSVGLDMWKAEKIGCVTSPYNDPLPNVSGQSYGMNCDPTRVGVEDYLLELASMGLNPTIPNASLGGHVYAPDGVNILTSMGAFEVWSGPGSMKYSRNYGSGKGIELVTTQPAVVGRYIFYNNSAWDGGDASANANDDAAIAPDKMALLPGGKASFLNYTSYSKGINGIMIDLPAMAGRPALAPSDFEFAVGNDNNPTGPGWTAPADPGVTIRPGEGYVNSDRITLIWTNGIKGKWLRVHIKPNATKGLPEDVFYFGNAPGDTGNSSTQVRVDAMDELAIRAAPVLFPSQTTIDDPCDVNRDRYVDTNDEYVARSNVTYFETDLQLIQVP